MHGNQRASAGRLMPKRTYTRTSEARPRRNNWQERAKEAGGRKAEKARLV